MRIMSSVLGPHNGLEISKPVNGVMIRNLEAQAYISPHTLHLPRTSSHETYSF